MCCQFSADLNEKLVRRIAENKLVLLTVNYEFTRCRDDGETDETYNYYRLRCNPFWMANSAEPLREIMFEVKLSPNVKSLACAFMGFSELESVSLKDTSGVEKVRMMFAGASAFDQSTGDWNTSGVADMQRMFENAGSFDQDIGRWDTSNVVSMRAMFRNARLFNHTVGTWNTVRAADMREMFDVAVSYSHHKPRERNSAHPPAMPRGRIQALRQCWPRRFFCQPFFYAARSIV